MQNKGFYRMIPLFPPLTVVFVLGVLPAITRWDRFPISTHPMFSERLSKNQVEAFQVFYRDLDGAESQIPIFCHKLAIYLLNRNLQEKNNTLVELTIRAVVLNKIDFSKAGTLLLYRVKNGPGAKPVVVKEYEMRLSSV